MRKVSFILLVLMSPLTLAETIEGQLDWANLHEVKSLLSGKVDKVAVKAGDAVKKGMLLLVIDEEYVAAALEAAKTNWQAQQALHQEAQKEWERTENLYDQTLISEHEKDIAKVKYATAASALANAKADLVAAKKRISQSQVISPFDGIVLQRLISEGQVVNNRFQARTMLRLADTSSRMVKVQITPEQRQKVSLGQKIKVKISSKSYSANLREIQYLNSEKYELQLQLSGNVKQPAGLKVKVEIP